MNEKSQKRKAASQNAAQHRRNNGGTQTGAQDKSGKRGIGSRLFSGVRSALGWLYAKIRRLFGLSKPESSKGGDEKPFAPADAAPWRWQSHGLTDVGRRRKINEDAFLDRSEIGLWMVADGMGGHHAGDFASSSLVEALSLVEGSPKLEIQAKQIKQCIEEVNGRLHRLASESVAGQIIGSTVVALVAKGLYCEVIWAGDSRLYRYRGNQLEQISADHSLMDELVRSGMMTAAEASAEGSGNIITRAVGAEAKLELDSIRFQAAPGDLFLLCSDGLSKELSDADIISHLKYGNLEITAQSLIGAALAHGGRDNVTVLLARPDAEIGAAASVTGKPAASPAVNDDPTTASMPPVSKPTDASDDDQITRFNLPPARRDDGDDITVIRLKSDKPK